MMKKYNLYLKEEYRGRGAIKYPGITGCDILGYNTPNCVLSGTFGKMSLYPLPTYEKIDFTQKEIDELPYGFVKLFDIIEVKEKLYYIKMPYGSDNYLNEYPNKTDVGFFSEDDVCNFKTKFTLPYIEDTYPLLKQFAVKAEEEE